MLPKSEIKDDKNLAIPPKLESILEYAKQTKSEAQKMLPKSEIKDDKNLAIPPKLESLLEKAKQTKSEAQKIDEIPVISIPPTPYAWCSSGNNKIYIIDPEMKQKYVSFDGASIRYGSKLDVFDLMVIMIGYDRTHVKEIPNTKLLVSLSHNQGGYQNTYHNLRSANLEIYDISQREKPKKIYSLGEVIGVTGYGDVAYNPRRHILGAISVEQKIAYHLFNLDTSKTGDIVKLLRRSRWHPQYPHYLQESTDKENWIEGFDFNPSGESVATIDRYGTCSISDVNTNKCGFYLELDPNKWNPLVPKKTMPKSRYHGHCRWSTNTGEPLLFVKYTERELAILDVEKALTWKKTVHLGYGGANFYFCFFFFI